MQLDLVDDGADLGVCEHVVQEDSGEIGHPDGTGEPGYHELFHGLVCFLVVDARINGGVAQLGKIQLAESYHVCIHYRFDSGLYKIPRHERQPSIVDEFNSETERLLSCQTYHSGRSSDASPEQCGHMGPGRVSSAVDCNAMSAYVMECDGPVDKVQIDVVKLEVKEALLQSNTDMLL